METFLRQISRLMADHNLKSKEFEENIGMKIGRWGKNAKSVDLDTVMYIAQQFNKSMDWLIYGKEIFTVQEHQESYEARLPALMDFELIAEVCAAVDDVLLDKKIKMAFLKKGRLISLVYGECKREMKKPTTHMVERYLLLAD
jgi:hypothetical protein